MILLKMPGIAPGHLVLLGLRMKLVAVLVVVELQWIEVALIAVGNAGPLCSQCVWFDKLVKNVMAQKGTVTSVVLNHPTVPVLNSAYWK